MELNIPNRFLKKMTDDHRVECENVLLKYGEIADKHMYFFDEYTDHSYKHIQYVLETASKLIPDSTMEVLNSTDIFVLLLSILYHDLGMHINFESIKYLYKMNPKDVYNKTDFRILWIDFVKDVSKNEIKGIDELYSIDSLDPTRYEEYRNTVSTFVRNNHPIIANIIAINGFPGKEKYINYNEKRYPFLYELAGIVACSHGMDLRNVIDYLKERYGDLWKTPFDCKAVYLMTLVRIADYLHITDDRISKYKLLLDNFDSKISQNEFLKHKSVYHSQQIYDNPETIYIYSDPEEFEVFIKMNQLIDSIQNELDHSWAILGEVYGSQNIRLCVRRITSNLKNTSWIDNSKFIAEKLKFEFDIRLMNLLVEPLYGNNPSYGVRELIQNATDACKSRSAIEEKKYFPNIEIRYDTKELIIKDNGIGMDIEVIKKYFLKIGSSFSDSKVWSEFNDRRTNKEEQILRNGKFGIGILSSFLIGDSIGVKSKKIGGEFVYKFEAGKNDNVINITKYKDDDFYGTEISIPIKNNINFNKVMLKWYRLNDVSISINGEEFKEVVDVDEVKQLWKKLDEEFIHGLKEVKWSYDYKIPSFELNGKKDEKPIKYEPNLICNGIIIPDKYDRKIESCIVSKWPTLLIKDSNWLVDLDLSRNELNSNLPFIRNLERELLKEFSNELKNLARKDYNKSTAKCLGEQVFITGAFKLDNFKDHKLFFINTGYAVFNQYFLDINNIKKVIRIWTRKEIKDIQCLITSDNIAYIFEGIGSHPNLKSEIVNYKKNMLNPSKVTLHLLEKDYCDYQNWAANIYKLSQKFIQDNTIIRYNSNDNNYMLSKFNLNVSTDDIALAVEYEYREIENDGSDIFTTYFSSMPIIPYNINS